MRKPQKLTALLLALTLLFACAACGSGNSTTDSGKTISGTLPEIIARLYDTVDVDDEQRDFLKNSVGTVEIPKDQSAYYFGVENLDFEEAVASEFRGKFFRVAVKVAVPPLLEETLVVVIL